MKQIGVENLPIVLYLFQEKSENMKRYFVYIFLLTSIYACQPVKIISTEQFTSYNPKQLKTFAFADLTEKVKVSRANSYQTEAYIWRIVVEEMERRGYELVEENPDVLLDLEVYLLNSEANQRTDTYQNYGYSRFGRFYRFDPVPNNQFPTESRLKARINLTFGEADAKTHLWKGRAETQLAKKAEKGALRLRETIDLLIDDYEAP